MTRARRPRTSVRSRLGWTVPALLAMVLAGATVAGCTGPEIPWDTSSPPTDPTASGASGSPDASNDPAQPAPAAAAPSRSFTVLGSGDVLLHEGLWSQAKRDAAAGDPDGYDFNKIYASARPVIATADLAICNLETPLGPAQGPFSGYPVFSVPPQVLDTLAWAGYDACSTASNHTIDKGEDGVKRTLDAMDEAGIKHTGSFRSEEEKDQNAFTMFDVQGVKVGWVAYVMGPPYDLGPSLNGLTEPKGKEYLANDARSADEILVAAHQAKQAGAEVVIASLHWGVEYSKTASSKQVSLAKKLLGSADVDLILGHHPHVVEPIEKIGDKWVAYSMGNQVSNQNFEYSRGTRDGIMPVFRFAEVQPGVFKVTDVEVHSVYMELNGGPQRLYDVTARLTSSGKLSSGLRGELVSSMRRSYDIVGKRGAYEAGAVMVGAGLFLD